MIRFAENNDVDQLKKLWKLCFGDSNSYIDLVFSTKFVPQNTIIYQIDNIIVASLYMQEYFMRIYNQILPIYYLAGLSTHPDYRNKGFMSKLINKSFDVMIDRQIPLSILVPAEGWLFDYYKQFGFVETFSKGDEEIDLKSILNNSCNIEEAFNVFEKKYQQFDFCVLKTLNDFDVIVKDYINDNYSPKYNLRAMAAIIDMRKLLQIYAKSHPQVEALISTQNIYTSEHTKFYINKGDLNSMTDDTNNDSLCDSINISHGCLTKLLFGIKPTNADVNSTFDNLFEEHNPIINLMLE